MVLQNVFQKWCVWNLIETRPGSKPAKVPINPNTGVVARPNAPETFGTYEQATARLDSGGHQGLGILMSSGPGVICVDIDSCLSEFGIPNAIAQDALQYFTGYNEVSQSGRGLHFFLRAEKPPKCKTKLSIDGCSVEIYSSKDTRFICITGNPFGGSEEKEILEGQEALDKFLERYRFVNEVTEEVSSGLDGRIDSDEDQHSDEDILKLLRTRNKRGKITRLFAGDTSAYENDDSAADLALCSEIAYYTTDPDQLRRIFEVSKLAERDKWRERRDYRDRTISTALRSCKGYYWDDIKNKPAVVDAVAEAERRFGPRLSGGIDDQLLLDKSGNLKPCLSNVIQILTRDHRTMSAVAYNEFSGKIEALRPLRSIFGKAASGEVGDIPSDDTTPIRAWLQTEYRMLATKGDVNDALVSWAKHTAFNPVTRRLDELARGWDGQTRLGTWLLTYLGVNAAACEQYVEAIGRKFLIGAVARAYQPGCKMDTMLVFEGAQGVGKSLAVRVIAEAVYPKGFVEGLPTGVDSVEAVRALRGAHIIELSELAAIQGKASIEQIKSFISKQTDTGRDPYSLRAETWPRTCVFIGTTNDPTYIADISGGRRFWGVKVGRIDIPGLRGVAEQLWGEAVAAYKAGEQWHLTETEAVTEANEQQRERMVTDAWDDEIVEWLQKSGRGQSLLSAGSVLSMKELFRAVFDQDINDRQQADQRRFGAALRRTGFTHRTLNGRKVWSIPPEHIDAVRVDALLTGTPGPDAKATQWVKDGFGKGARFAVQHQ